MKGVPHYTKDGSLFKVAMHKMKDGTLNSGKTHTKSSKTLFHMKDLPKAIRNRIIKMRKKA